VLACTFRVPIFTCTTETQVPPLVVNAYYSVLENTIRITAATINGGWFNADRPQYMNYGEIGATIGHEMFHGEQNTQIANARLICKYLKIFNSSF
jgi:Peptidase family M13